MVRIDENYTIIFLPEQEILVKGYDSYSKRRYSVQDYMDIYNIYIGDISKISDDRLLWLQQICDFLVDDKIIEKYVKTPFEKTSIFLQTVGDKNIDYIDILKKKVVMIIGLGGIGCGIVEQLLSVGVSEFILIDCDVVDVTNLNRQFCYRREDLGLRKIDSMEKYIISKTPNAKILKYDIHLKSSDALQEIYSQISCEIDLVINAADMPLFALRKELLSFCKKNGINYGHASTGVYRGESILIQSNKKHVFQKMINECEQVIEYAKETKPCSSSIGFWNSIITDLFCQDIIFFFLGMNKFVRCLNYRYNFWLNK